MKTKIISVLFICILIALPMAKADAVLGTPDKVPSATLIVPLMEKSISGPENTLIVADYLCANPSQVIHWELWDIDGNLTGLQGNVTIGQWEDWSSDMGSIVGTASPAQLTQLTDGDFYRGFLTIDLVTASTTETPGSASYPLQDTNCLTGYVYYVRLTEGAANGINMIHIETANSSADDFLEGLYRGDDNREEIDADARYFSLRMLNAQITGQDSNDKIDFTWSRVFLNPGNSGKSRIVLWTWCTTSCPGTNVSPSADSGGPFPYWLTNESGVQVQSTTIMLDHVVNIIDVTGTQNGTVWINDIPDGFHIYGFVSNAAEGSAQETWEAMFETTIMVDPSVTP